MQGKIVTGILETRIELVFSDTCPVSVFQQDRVDFLRILRIKLYIKVVVSREDPGLRIIEASYN